MSAFRSFLRLAAGALLLGGLAACATPPEVATTLPEPAQLVIESGSLPTRAEVAGVPFIPQEENFCGPASLAMALAWSGLPTSQHDIAPQVFTPGREGTLRSDMLTAARRNGRIAVTLDKLEDVLAELAAGHPVIVFQNLGLDLFPVWHFAVATGYDLAASEIRLHSGLEADTRMPLATFDQTWARGDRWAMVVLPPESLPATADELIALRAAAGLERAGRPAEAARAYATILGRWPDSFVARMGLGNARHAAGDLAGAELAFRAVIAHRPEAAAAWNNLAQNLADQDRLEEALEAAQHAVALGGANLEFYRTTLREIEARQAWSTEPPAAMSRPVPWARRFN